MISARRMLRVGAPLGRRAFSDTAMHGTTILCVRRGGKVVMIGDGQVSMGNVVVKGNARKVRRIGDDILVGFAGSTADAFTLLERLEKKLEEHPGQLTRACVDLAKAWRTDKYLRRLEALILVADRSVTYELTGTGDVLEPTDGVMGIGSGGQRGAGAARGVDRVGGASDARGAPRAGTPSPPRARSRPSTGSRPRTSRSEPWTSPRTCASLRTRTSSSRSSTKRRPATTPGRAPEGAGGLRRAPRLD